MSTDKPPVNQNEPEPARIFEDPVAWLLGQQLLGGLKGMLLYTAYGAKLDPRDWMTPTVQNFDTEAAKKKGEFWFDYMSDVGDGTKAMYSIAYLVMSTLWTTLPEKAIRFPDQITELEVSNSQDGNTFKLPRGEFLFVGGDTAYHAADYLSLVNRIQRPFRYAYEDLRAKALIADSDPRRPIFGIPGNHDYYDQIDGFRRQFRKPTRKEGPLPPKQSGPTNAQLTIPAYERVQEASYVALRLPFGWWLWGLDTESASDRRDQHLDRRQEKFFESLATENGKFKAPDKLILATSAPSTVFGQIADQDNQKVSKPLKAIKVSRPFLPKDKSDLATAGDAALEIGQCRLDISGDVHHYARYWGPQSATTPRADTTATRPDATSYASVVSGAGGAFHHPSTTYNNELCEQVLFPPEQASREAVAARVFNFRNIWKGGYVFLFGFIIAFTIFFGMTVTQSSRQFISNLGILNRLELTRWEKIRPTIVQPGNTRPCEPVKPLALWTTLGVVGDVWHPPADCTAENPTYFFPQARTWPRDLIIGQVLIWLSLIATIATLVLSLLTKWIFDDSASAFDTRNPNRKIVPIVAVVSLLTVIGFLTVEPYRNHITPFISSLIVLYSILAAVTAIVLNVRYSEFVFRKSFVPRTETGFTASLSRFADNNLGWVLWIAAIVAISWGLWFFGKNNLPAFLMSDIIFILVLVVTALGIVLLAFFASGALLFRSSRVVRFIGKLLIGLWHLKLQLLVPFVLVTLGSWLDWAIAAALLFLPIVPARFLLSKNSRVGLSLLWLVYGALMLTLPYLTRLFVHWPPVFTDWTGWWSVIPALVAGGFGAVLCCLWTGWYFGVCFAFNGHNNEVGGAARIEKFKEFIRFRVTEEGLTGYVIAVSDVSSNGQELKPKLIDVFHLTPKI